MTRSAVVVVLFAIAGCAPPANVPGIAFPRYDLQSAVPAALDEGTLEERDGCLVLEGVVTYVLLWPQPYGIARAEGGELVVLDGRRSLVTVGSHVTVSGGELTETAAARQFVDSLPPECQNPPYWQVTSIEEGSIEVPGG